MCFCGERPAGADAEPLGVRDPLLQLRALLGRQLAGGDRGVDPGVQLGLEGGAELVAGDAETRGDGVAERGRVGRGRSSGAEGEGRDRDERGGECDVTSHDSILLRPR